MDLSPFHFALRHPDWATTVGATSPDALDFASWFLATDGQHLSTLAFDWLRLEDAYGPPGQMVSYAANWSPDAKEAHGFVWPSNPKTGSINASVWKRWLSQSPSELIKDPAILRGVQKHLSGRIFLAAGTQDEFDLHEPTKRFHDQLSASGVRNEFVSDDEGHGGAFTRKQRMLSFVLKSLAR